MGHGAGWFAGTLLCSAAIAITTPLTAAEDAWKWNCKPTVTGSWDCGRGGDSPLIGGDAPLESYTVPDHKEVESTPATTESPEPNTTPPGTWQSVKGWFGSDGGQPGDTPTATPPSPEYPAPPVAAAPSVPLPAAPISTPGYQIDAEEDYETSYPVSAGLPAQDPIAPDQPYTAQPDPAGYSAQGIAEDYLPPATTGYPASASPAYGPAAADMAGGAEPVDPSAYLQPPEPPAQPLIPTPQTPMQTALETPEPPPQERGAWESVKGWFGLSSEEVPAVQATAPMPVAPPAPSVPAYMPPEPPATPSYAAPTMPAAPGYQSDEEGEYETTYPISPVAESQPEIPPAGTGDPTTGDWRVVRSWQGSASGQAPAADPEPPYDAASSAPPDYTPQAYEPPPEAYEAGYATEAAATAHPASGYPAAASVPAYEPPAEAYATGYSGDQAAAVAGYPTTGDAPGPVATAPNYSVTGYPAMTTPPTYEPGYTGESAATEPNDPMAGYAPPSAAYTPPPTAYPSDYGSAPVDPTAGYPASQQSGYPAAMTPGYPATATPPAATEPPPAEEPSTWEQVMGWFSFGDDGEPPVATMPVGTVVPVPTPSAQYPAHDGSGPPPIDSAATAIPGYGDPQTTIPNPHAEEWRELDRDEGTATGLPPTATPETAQQPVFVAPQAEIPQVPTFVAPRADTAGYTPSAGIATDPAHGYRSDDPEPAIVAAPATLPGAGLEPVGLLPRSEPTAAAPAPPHRRTPQYTPPPAAPVAVQPETATRPMPAAAATSPAPPRRTPRYTPPPPAETPAVAVAEPLPLPATTPGAPPRTAQPPAARPKTVYTIQLVGTSELYKAQLFIDHYRLGGEARIVQGTKDGQPWYMIHHGQYDDQPSAATARDQLPEEIRDLGPWIKPVRYSAAKP